MNWNKIDKDSPPKVGETVWIYCKGRGVERGYYFGDTEWYEGGCWSHDGSSGGHLHFLKENHPTHVHEYTMPDPPK